MNIFYSRLSYREQTKLFYYLYTPKKKLHRHDYRQT